MNDVEITLPEDQDNMLFVVDGLTLRHVAEQFARAALEECLRRGITKKQGYVPVRIWVKNFKCNEIIWDDQSHGRTNG